MTPDKYREHLLAYNEENRDLYSNRELCVIRQLKEVQRTDENATIVIRVKDIKGKRYMHAIIRLGNGTYDDPIRKYYST